MAYDPMRRGDHPVGVRTIELADSTRDRRLTAEVWYPASAAHAGADLAAATRDRYPLMAGFPEPWQAAVRDAEPAGDRAPLVVFSHGFAGHRRQSTFVCTHLASHGYVVASLDHAGNTFVDVFTKLGTSMAGIWQASMADRPLDVRLLIDAAADGRLGRSVDCARVGLTGHSFGGWTALQVVAEEPRVAAVVALAPAAGLPHLRALLDVAWTRPVPTMIVAAARDSVLPLAGIEAVFADLPAPATLVVLDNTDHLHFCDNAHAVHEQFRTLSQTVLKGATPLPPFAELAPARHGRDATLGLTLAYLDAYVRGDADARALVTGDLSAYLGAHEIVARACSRETGSVE